MSHSEVQIYKFDYCEVLKSNNPNHYFKAVHVYKFNADGNRYLVTFEEYQHNFYMLHFCLEEKRENEDKFNLLANVGLVKAKKVLATCAHIALSLYEKNPLASFFFTASPTLEVVSKADQEYTNRFSVYKFYAEFFLTSKNFTHLSFSNQYSYLVLNKEYEQLEPEALQKITGMLKLS